MGPIDDQEISTFGWDTERDNTAFAAAYFCLEFIEIERKYNDRAARPASQTHPEYHALCPYRG